MLLKRRMGNRKWKVGNGKSGMGNVEWGMENGKLNGKLKMVNIIFFYINFLYVE